VPEESARRNIGALAKIGILRIGAASSEIAARKTKRARRIAGRRAGGGAEKYRRSASWQRQATSTLARQQCYRRFGVSEKAAAAW
jgi:hypothetical protein